MTTADEGRCMGMNRDCSRCARRAIPGTDFCFEHTTGDPQVYTECMPKADWLRGRTTVRRFGRYARADTGYQGVDYFRPCRDRMMFWLGKLGYSGMNRDALWEYREEMCPGTPKRYRRDDGY